MATIQKCPICEGRGIVDYNFYKDKNGLGITEECRTCKGLGVLWDYTVISYSSPYLPIQDNNKPYNPCDNCLVRLDPNWNGVCHCELPRTQIHW